MTKLTYLGKEDGVNSYALPTVIIDEELHRAVQDIVKQCRRIEASGILEAIEFRERTWLLCETYNKIRDRQRRAAIGG